MIQKKVCLIGSFAVGKTSLVQRFVESIFNESYLTTIGVKIDKKPLYYDNQHVNLMIWDIAGEDAFTEVNEKYLRGMSGCLIIADGTRDTSFKVAISLYQKVQKVQAKTPVVFAVNKCDLEDQWTNTDMHIKALQSLGHPVLKTSAKSGKNVELMFQQLTAAMVQ